MKTYLISYRYTCGKEKTVQGNGFEIIKAEDIQEAVDKLFKSYPGQILVVTNVYCEEPEIIVGQDTGSHTNINEMFDITTNDTFKSLKAKKK